MPVSPALQASVLQLDLFRLQLGDHPADAIVIRRFGVLKRRLFDIEAQVQLCKSDIAAT